MRIVAVFFCLTFSLAGFSQKESGQKLPRPDSHVLDSTKADLKGYSSVVDSLWLRQLESHSLIYNYRVNLDSAEVVRNLPDSVYEARIAALNQNSPFHFTFNPAVEKYINEYLRYSSHLKKVMGLSEYYFPMIEQELDRAGLPLELKYLSVIESALNPEARSYAGASGLWQFMLPTGRECGLKINSYVDERNDPVASTKAACTYLGRLYEIYGVWELALSAYNCGPGNVNKAIKRAGGSKNYWKIRPFLPLETQKYVPRFMSMAYLMTYGQKHNVMPVSPDFNYWTVDTVMVHRQVNFKTISSMVSVKEEDLRVLNPQFKKGIVPQSQDGQTLVLPVSYVSKFVEVKDSLHLKTSVKEQNYIANVNEQRPKKTPVSSGKKINYRVRSGDVLGSIAQRHSVSVSQLKKWNGIRGTRIKVGQNLTIYQNTSKSSETKEGEAYSFYTVKRGDTLWDIAKRYPGVSADEIKSWNRHVNPRNLKAGTKLKIRA